MLSRGDKGVVECGIVAGRGLNSFFEPLVRRSMVIRLHMLGPTQGKSEGMGRDLRGHEKIRYAFLGTQGTGEMFSSPLGLEILSPRLRHARDQGMIDQTANKNGPLGPAASTAVARRGKGKTPRAVVEYRSRRVLGC